jgi:hypothetical protein
VKTLPQYDPERPVSDRQQFISVEDWQRLVSVEVVSIGV